MRGGKYDESTGMWVPDKGLGMAKVLDYINVKWWNDGDEAKRDGWNTHHLEDKLLRRIVFVPQNATLLHLFEIFHKHQQPALIF